MLTDSPRDGEKFLGEYGLLQFLVGLLIIIHGFYVGHAGSAAIYISPVLL